MEEEYGKKEQTAKTNASRKQVCDCFWSGVSLDVCGRGLRGLPRFIIPLSSARSEPSPCLLQASKKRHAVSSRSEEHTSELQSHLNLVCRLLLEKKKITQPLPQNAIS